MMSGVLLLRTSASNRSTFAALTTSVESLLHRHHSHIRHFSHFSATETDDLSTNALSSSGIQNSKLIAWPISNGFGGVVSRRSFHAGPALNFRASIPASRSGFSLFRCYLWSGNLDRGQQVFEDYMNSEKPAMVEQDVTLVEEAMAGYTPQGMQLALETLEKMAHSGFVLSIEMGNDLLLTASGEKTGDYKVANYIFDLMQSQYMTPSGPAFEAYYRGLKERNLPADDRRLIFVSQTYENQHQD